MMNKAIITTPRIVGLWMLFGFAVGLWAGNLPDSPDENIVEAAEMMQMASARMEGAAEIMSSSLIPGDSFTVSVTTSATKIQGSAFQLGYQCTVDSAYAGTLYIGGSNVTSSLYRKTATGGGVFQADLRWEYALSSSGTATLHCSEFIK